MFVIVSAESRPSMTSIAVLLGAVSAPQTKIIITVLAVGVVPTDTLPDTRASTYLLLVLSISVDSLSFLSVTKCTVIRAVSPLHFATSTNCLDLALLHICTAEFQILHSMALMMAFISQAL